jgi:hypothetical protein
LRAITYIRDFGDDGEFGNKAFLKENDLYACDWYFIGWIVKKIQGMIIAIGITIVDISLRTIVYKIIKRIGYRRISKETRDIMTIVFFSSFFNMAILIILSQANFKDIPIVNTIFGLNLKGKQYSDMTKAWYAETGNLLSTSMMINAFTPQIDLAIDFTKKWLQRLNDRGCCYRCSKKPRVTKATTV